VGGRVQWRHRSKSGDSDARTIHINAPQKATKEGGGGEKEKELQEEDIEAILAEV
jgi:hypothetical protein